jgi:hypothetical protein
MLCPRLEKEEGRAGGASLFIGDLVLDRRSL